MPTNEPYSNRTVGFATSAALILCTAISVLSTDLYVPSLPHLSQRLNSTAQTVQLTMTLNLAAYAIAQLAHGPLADRLGRRRMLLIGMSGFATASIGCALATNIGELLLGRVAQGLFSSIPSVVVMLLIRELYNEQRSVGMMSLQGIAVATVPIIGPILGGYIFVYAGWQANFVVLAVAALAVLFLVLKFVPESRNFTPRLSDAGGVILSYIDVISTPVILRYLIPLSLTFGALFAFITAMPSILIQRLGIPTEQYGYYYGLFIAVHMCGFLAADRLAHKLAIERLFIVGVGLSMVGGIALLAAVSMGWETVTGILVTASIYGVGLAIAITAGPVQLLGLLKPPLRGTGSSLLGSLQLASASLASFLVSVFYDGTALPMAATIAAMTSVGMFVLISPKLLNHKI